MSFFVGIKLWRSIQMNGQIGNSHDGFIDVDQTMLQQSVGGLDDNPTGDFEIAIEPSVPNTAAVTLHAYLDGREEEISSPASSS